jgi:hypothetical protein
LQNKRIRGNFFEKSFPRAPSKNFKKGFRMNEGEEKRAGTRACKISGEFTNQFVHMPKICSAINK